MTMTPQNPTNLAKRFGQQKRFANGTGVSSIKEIASISTAPMIDKKSMDMRILR
jgi:hypothetical protein